LVAIAELVIVVIHLVGELAVVASILSFSLESAERIVFIALLPLFIRSDEAVDAGYLPVVLRLVYRPVRIDPPVLVLI
jgi:hypothetical protein